MHTCDTCMFCHYRRQRIAAYGVREDSASGRQPGTGPAQPAPPVVARQTSEPRREHMTQDDALLVGE